MSKARKKLLLIDGYNVLRSGGRYSLIDLPDYTDDTFNVARERLINDVISYAGNDAAAIIVFDGQGNRYSHGEPQTVGGVQIIFSSVGQSADRVIEKLAHDARSRNIETLVVTSDSSIQDTVFGEGIDRMSARGFCRELEAQDVQASLDDRPVIAHKNTIASRIPPETLLKLQRLRDGA